MYFTRPKQYSLNLAPHLFKSNHPWLLSFLICICLNTLGATAASDAPPEASNANVISDVQVPGEAAPLDKKVHDEHPWSIVEKPSGQANPRAAVEPEIHNSPRSLMWSLGRALDAYREVLTKEGRTYTTQAKLDWIQERIAECFDLSDIGPQFHLSAATDAGVHLRGILRRVPLSAWETIPDAKTLELRPADDELTHYRFDDVPIELILIQEGESTGEWVISQETRQRAEAGYQRIRHLEPIAGEGDLFHLHFFEPGWMIPSSWIQGLPTWAGYEIWEQALWQWCLTLFAILIVSTILILIYLPFRNRGNAPLTIPRRIIKFAFLVLKGTVAYTFIDFLQYQVFMSGIPLEIFTFFFSSIMVIAYVMAILTLGNIIAEIIISSPQINPAGLDAAMIRVAAKTIGIAMSAIVLFRILSQLGFSPNTLLAGAGVTGLAIALAAQDTLKNFFASIILLLERPFREGDRIRIGDDIGTVESIGLRSTCIQIRGGNLAYLPNEMLAHGRIENISRRPHIRCELVIGVTYTTTPSQLEHAVEIIRSILDEKVRAPDNFNPRVFFTKFSDSSLNIDCTYWQATTNYSHSLKISQAVNLEILDRFNNEGIEFAFPTMTIIRASNDEIGDTASTSS
jgi:MscS family membrane protein